MLIVNPVRMFWPKQLPTKKMEIDWRGCCSVEEDWQGRHAERILLLPTVLYSLVPSNARGLRYNAAYAREWSETGRLPYCRVAQLHHSISSGSVGSQ